MRIIKGGISYEMVFFSVRLYNKRPMPTRDTGLLLYKWTVLLPSYYLLRNGIKKWIPIETKKLLEVQF